MIKFNLYNIVNTETGDKVKVFYNNGVDIHGNDRVAIYAKDYGSQLSKIFNDVRNETDSMTDYFETDTVAFYEGDAFFQEAKAAAERYQSKQQARWAKKYGEAA